jgi:hypothetical protein
MKWQMIIEWFYGLGAAYGVDPLIFGAIYVGAIPFFTLSVAWAVKSARNGRPVLFPLFCALLCMVSAYLYLLAAGRNIPIWVYAAVVAMIAMGVISTVKKVRTRLEAGFGPSDQTGT